MPVVSIWPKVTNRGLFKRRRIAFLLSSVVWFPLTSEFESCWWRTMYKFQRTNPRPHRRERPKRRSSSRATGQKSDDDADRSVAIHLHILTDWCWNRRRNRWFEGTILSDSRWWSQQGKPWVTIERAASTPRWRCPRVTMRIRRSTAFSHHCPLEQPIDSMSLHWDNIGRTRKRHWPIRKLIIPNDEWKTLEMKGEEKRRGRRRTWFELTL